MKSIALTVLAGALALCAAGCGETANGVEAEEAQTAAMAAATMDDGEETEAVDMMAAPVCVREVPPDAVCTMDINECGHAGACDCGGGYVYDAALGKCLLDLEGVGDATFIEVEDTECVQPATGVCTRDINACGQPSRCGCEDGFVWNSVAGKCLKDFSL